MNTIEKAVRRLAQKRAQADVDKEDLEASSVADELGYPAGIAMTASSAQAVGTGTAGSQDTGVVLGAQQALADERVARTIPAESGAAEDFEPDLEIMSQVSDLILSPDGGRNRTAEEFRMIKRPLLVGAFNRQDPGKSPPNLIMVTSSLQGEGKTFTSLNLAISITMELDSTVLLVDADVAKPGLSKTLGIQDKHGLIEHLVDRSSNLSDLLLRTDIPKLTVMPAGQKHKRSTELLASANMKQLLEELASRYPDRIVLFDSPPLLETSEASVLASQMGQVVIVVESETTPQAIVTEALSQFEGRENVYLVLNKCKQSIFSGKYGSGYGYGYGYGYGSYGEN